MKQNYNNTILIIPAYNEEPRIQDVIKEIKNDLPESSVLVVNDNSKDNTAQKAKQAGAEVISHPYNMGYSAGLLTGLKYAKSSGFEYAVLFDGDGQHIADEVKKLFAEKEKSNADIIIGSRFLKKQDYNHGLFKTIGTGLFRMLIRIFTGRKITDPTSGFQLLNKQAIGMYSEMAGFPEYPDANLIIYMLRKGFTISETAVLMRERSDGESMHQGVWRPIRYMILVLYSLLLAALFSKKDKK